MPEFEFVEVALSADVKASLQTEVCNHLGQNGAIAVVMVLLIKEKEEAAEEEEG